MNQNKTSKYLKYAIGEILLVVIGILIALQINNWNNNRNNDKIEQQYIARLISELNEEIVRFEYLRDGFQSQIESVNNLLQFWQEDNMIVKDTAKFWSDFFKGSGPGPWHKEPVIWTQLVQSGELKLIKDHDAIETLFKHYSDIKSVADNFNEYPTQTTNEIRKLMATTFAKNNYLLSPSSERSLPSSENLKAVLTDKELYRVPFVRVGIIARIHAGQMDRLMKSSQNAIGMLEKNLTTDN